MKKEGAAFSFLIARITQRHVLSVHQLSVQLRQKSIKDQKIKVPQSPMLLSDIFNVKNYLFCTERTRQRLCIASLPRTARYFSLCCLAFANDVSDII
jgi:hypothetical protein